MNRARIILILCVSLLCVCLVFAITALTALRNAVAETGLQASSRQAVAEFQSILEQYGITATVRRSLGGDIDASCGQLRRNYETT